MFITPYSPPQPKTALYEGSSAKEDTVYRATVNEVAEDSLKITLNDGPSRGETAVVDYRKTATNLLRTGETILVVGSEKDDTLYFLDHFRIPILIILCAIFAVTVLLVGRKKGLRSLTRADPTSSYCTDLYYVGSLAGIGRLACNSDPHCNQRQ